MPEEALHGAGRRVAAGEDGTVGNRKHVAVSQSLGMFLLRDDQAVQEILVLDFLAIGWVLALFQLAQRRARYERVLGGQEGDQMPQRISSENVVEPRHLPDNAVVPLRVVYRLDVIVDVDSCFQEAEFLGERNFS